MLCKWTLKKRRERWLQVGAVGALRGTVRRQRALVRILLSPCVQRVQGEPTAKLLQPHMCHHCIYVHPQVLHELGCVRGSTYALLRSRTSIVQRPPALDLDAEEKAAALAALDGPVYKELTKAATRQLLMRLNEFVLKASGSTYVLYEEVRAAGGRGVRGAGVAGARVRACRGPSGDPQRG